MENTSLKNCSVEGLKILGDYWTLQIIQELASGCKRFSELERSIEKSNPTTLASRLKRMESEGIIVRQEETVDKISVVYSLTEKGRGVLPILEQINIFSQQFLN
jgi:DNA-binding HxlR family transcriptional regulator